jgi:hypothetical protein
VLAPVFWVRGKHVPPWVTGPGLQRRGLFYAGTLGNRLGFCGKERCPIPEACETTIGELRKTYGADFAKGCADNEKIADVLRKLRSLRMVIREREARRFEQI